MSSYFYKFAGIFVGMNGKLISYGFALLTAFTACAPSTTPRGSRNGTNTNVVNYNNFNDDLAAVRPSYTITKTVEPAKKPIPVTAPTPKPTDRATLEGLSVNKKLDAVLDTIAQKNRSVRYAAGYRIQIYVGNEREEADAAKLQVYRSFPELSPYLSYKQPTYRLKVGDFMRRLDADWYLSQLKQQFTSVSLQPDKVDIRRSLLIK